MARRTVPLEPAHVDVLEPLAGCTGWLRAPGDTAVAKADWVRSTTQEWGPCGLVVRADRADGEPVAYVVYAPPAHLPGLARLPTAPVSPDALVLAELWVRPDHRGGGLARHLVRAAARDLVDRYGARVPALETFACTDGTPAADDREPCLRPRGLCEAVGFVERRGHPAVPRLRMEPRTAVDWRGGVEHALERLRAGVRPAPVRPRASPRTTKPREADLPGLP